MKWNEASAGQRVKVKTLNVKDGKVILDAHARPVFKLGMVVKRCHDAYTGKIPMVLVMLDEREHEAKSGFSGERVRPELLELA